MKDSLLLKLAVTCSMTGILLLFFLSQTQELKETEINSIDESHFGRDVRITGEIESIRETEKTLFLEISSGKGSVKAIFFKSSEETGFEKGMRISVVGEVEEYMGMPEIIASEIKLIKTA